MDAETPSCETVKSQRFDPLAHPILLATPHRVEMPLAWAGHIPFAMLLVDLLRPRLLVELGTHSGNSYNAFCQAVHSLSIKTKCWAVDTWQGDPQAGHYGSEVYESLRSYQNGRYGAFSTLLRTTFDEAASQFAPGSIDLLHIDGLHTYEAVRHDFETWQPTLSDRAVVLFHDTTVHHGDFGVWKLWEELQGRYPSMEFPHCNGLGVLGVGDRIPEDVRDLLSLQADRRSALLLLMERLGDGITTLAQLRESEARTADLANTRDAIDSRLRTASAEAEAMRASVEEAIGLRDASVRDLLSAQEEIARLSARATELAAMHASAQAKAKHAQEETAAYRSQAEATAAALREVLASRAWRMTSPLRAIAERLRRSAR